ncbi:MAG: hypothetical protein JWO86_3833 [Myxococcaceae bacterium]|nr:hypothetical protein [Myxococcaceae bacterium]MEA2752744.1 hypothetical protein [Myxococcales bacterium]
MLTEATRATIPSVRTEHRIAAVSIVALIGAGMVVGACGFDGAGSHAAAGGPSDGSTLADVTTGGSGSGGDGGPIEGGVVDGGDSSVPLFEAGQAPYTLRVKSGLVAFYELEEGTGLIAHDSVPGGPNLNIYEPTKAVWKAHALTFVDFTQVDTRPFPLTTAFAACTLSNEVTVEAWVESTLLNEDVHTRIATVATDNSNLDFALGANTTDGMWASVKANENLTPTGKLTTGLTHLVMTRTASDSTLRLYVNGAKIDELAGVSSLSAWSDQPLFVGNGSGNDRGWRGALHLLAIYSRALTPAEIATNHGAGADP